MLKFIIFHTDFQGLKESRDTMEENNVKPANEVSILSEKIETTLMPATSGNISESNVDLTMSENDNIIKGKCSKFDLIFYQLL